MSRREYHARYYAANRERRRKNRRQSKFRCALRAVGGMDCVLGNLGVRA